MNTKLIFDALNDVKESISLSRFDDILAELDKQGAIEESMLEIDRDLSLKFAHMLSEINNKIK